MFKTIENKKIMIIDTLEKTTTIILWIRVAHLNYVRYIPSVWVKIWADGLSYIWYMWNGSYLTKTDFSLNKVKLQFRNNTDELFLMYFVINWRITIIVFYIILFSQFYNTLPWLILLKLRQTITLLQFL